MGQYWTWSHNGGIFVEHNWALDTDRDMTMQP